MFAVTIDLDAYDRLPPRQLKAMLRALRFADEGGVVHASLTMLAMPGLSRSSAHRELAGLEEEGHVQRQERSEGGFLWRIGRRFRCRAQSPRKPFRDGTVLTDRRPGSRDAGCSPASWRNSPDSGNVSPDGTTVPPAETPVPQRGTTDSRAPARLELSSGSKEPSEREQLSHQDEIPVGWEEAAAAERRLAGLGPVNLRAEWRKLLAHVEGQPVNIWRWRGWVLKARADLSARAEKRGEPVHSGEHFDGDALPGDERQKRQARDWVRRGFWLRDGSWGPAPDQPGCGLPPALIAWCLRERAALAA